MTLAVACGDDGSSDDSPNETPSPRDSGTSSRPDATVPSTRDTGVEEDPGRDVDAGRDDDEDTDEPADAGVTADAGTGSNAAALRGKAITDENVCTSCHQASYAGAGFYPNITPDMTTGIGSWTDKQISDAISAGKDKDGENLCSLMTRYKFSASELTDVVAFLRSLPAKANKISAECPGK